MCNFVYFMHGVLHDFVGCNSRAYYTNLEPVKRAIRFAIAPYGYLMQPNS